MLDKYKYSELPTEPESSQKNMTSVERGHVQTTPAQYTSLGLDDTSDHGRSGEEAQRERPSPTRAGVQSEIELGQEETERSAAPNESIMQRLYRAYKGLFVGSIADVEVANMIKAYGKSLKTFRTHRKCFFLLSLIEK